MSDRAQIRVFFFVLVFLGGAVCGNCWGGLARAVPAELDAPRLEEAPEEDLLPLPPAPEPAPAPDPGPTGAERAAALLLARYAAHEASFGAPADLLLLWQAAESHGESLEERVRWLRRHSRCVAARRPRVEPPRRCRWARALRWSPRRPAFYPARWPWDGEAWLAYLDLALEVVRGEELRRPCVGPIDTWDGRRWLDERLEEGFEEVECLDPWTGEPTLNAGFRFPDWREARDRRAEAPSSSPASASDAGPTLAASGGGAAPAAF